MQAIMLMFDSLNRHMLPPYGCGWTHAPNFARLAQHAVTFDNCYVGSMPCMPARRELHTGRYNLLHRSWGPLEPYDDSVPEILKNNGVYTHLVSDHYHYWEEGGATYHTRYNSWEIVRGQEGDPWQGQVRDPHIPPCVGERTGGMWRQDWVNRQHMQREEDQPQPQTVARGLEFIRRNAGAGNWLLQIETFDPHEPFFTQQRYKDLYPHDYRGPHFDWPPYRRVVESPDQVQHCRYEYAALLSMCDHYLGQVLDLMDELDLWRDTLLIVNTDHGFLLGEHDWWAKVVQPHYNEIAHTPLFIWDPRAAVRGARRQALVQTIDLPATLLDYFRLPLPPAMQGRPLRETILHDTPVREAALYGLFGAHVNVTDGRYTYLRAPADARNAPLYEYTLMPTHMRHTFDVSELQDIGLAQPFPFSKGCRLMRIAGRAWAGAQPMQTLLFDLRDDPAQSHPLQDAAAEAVMVEHLLRLMRASDAPEEQYRRLGLVGC